MSEPTKKPGARDISDLKARLGLKKGAEGAAPRQTAAIPVPSGSKIPGAFVPPPPGVAPPQPAAPPQPVIPDASVDPFGAMNAMAAAGATARPHQPEFVIVNDGKPVEQVAQGGKAGRYVKIGAIVLAPLFVGYIFGGINKANSSINDSITEAGLMFDDFTEVGKGLLSLQETLQVAKDRGKGQYVPFDKDLTAALEELKLQAPGTEILFRANMSNYAPGTAVKIFTFYQGVTNLYGKIENHKRLAKADQKKQAPKPFGNYAVVLRVPSQGADEKTPPQPYVELVELGAPICTGDTKPSEQGCPPDRPPEKFQIRVSPQAPFGGGLPWARKVETVTADSVLELRATEVQGAFMQGAKEFVDTIGYVQRINEIDAMVEELAQQRSDVQNLLNVEKNHGKRFAL